MVTFSHVPHRNDAFEVGFKGGDNRKKLESKSAAPDRILISLSGAKSLPGEKPPISAGPKGLCVSAVAHARENFLGLCTNWIDYECVVMAVHLLGPHIM